MKSKEPSNAAIIGGFVCAIFSLLFVWGPYFGLPLAIIGYVLPKKSEHGLAGAARVIAILGIVLNTITMIMLIIGLLFLESFGY